MIVDCGGGTVDLTTVKLSNENQLSEVTERAGDYCGSAFIDAEFIKYLRKKLGNRAIDLLKNNYYGQMQYMVQEFCQKVKMPFTGDDSTFVYEIDLEKVSPVLLQHVTDEVRETMVDAEWLIELDYETIKSMFDEVIDRIIRMIQVQLENCQETCSAIFLVGGFGQSEYLQKRIIQKFKDHKVYVPTNPIAAISRGAAIYGLSFRNSVDDDDIDDDWDDMMLVIHSRVLKFTYGIKVFSPWKPGEPEDRKKELFRFHNIGETKKAKKGNSAKINEEFTVSNIKPTLPFQTRGDFEIYYTRKYNAKYCDEDGVRLLGKLIINWPDKHLGLDRPTTFKLAFGKAEITATAKNEKNGQNYQVLFKIDQEEEE
jgi:molecular chaperone DnaK (HSP70)